METKSDKPRPERPAYFPDLSLDADKRSHEFMASWFSEHLRQMREPSLLDSSRDPAYHGYRFLWLRTFDRPICIRLEIGPSGTAALFIKMTSGQGGYSPGWLVVDESVSLPRQTSAAVLDHLKEADFWLAPKSADHGHDGAEWIIEGAKDGSYHVVRRWSPGSGAFRDAALFFLELSGLDAGKIY